LKNCGRNAIIVGKKDLQFLDRPRQRDFQNLNVSYNFPECVWRARGSSAFFQKISEKERQQFVTFFLSSEKAVSNEQHTLIASLSSNYKNHMVIKDRTSSSTATT
jgi:hypothetical protein